MGNKHCDCPICQADLVLNVSITCITLGQAPDDRSRRVAAERVKPARPVVAVGTLTRAPEVVASEHFARMTLYLDAAQS